MRKAYRVVLTENWCTTGAHWHTTPSVLFRQMEEAEYIAHKKAMQVLCNLNKMQEGGLLRGSRFVPRISADGRTITIHRRKLFSSFVVLECRIEEVTL